MKTNRSQLLIIIFILFGITNIAYCQERPVLKLTDAYRMAEVYYPLTNSKRLAVKISELNIEALNRERLPTITGNVEGKYQSDNITIGGDGPTFPINVTVPLESYKAYAGFNFILFDGGLISSKKDIERASLNVNQQQLEVRLRGLKDRINLLFFSIKLARQQFKLLTTSILDIQSNIESAEAGVNNGILLESELSKLKVRRLELESERAGLTGDIKAYLLVFGELIGKEITEETVLMIPEGIDLSNVESISRPEQELFEYQKQQLSAQKGIISADRKPKLSLFGEGGVGTPNPLNFTNTETSVYGLVGVKLSWKLTDWRKGKKDREKINVQIRRSEVDRLTFEFDILTRQQEFQSKIEAIKEQLLNDEEIVKLHSEILEQANVQLLNGVINLNDYLIQVNAELSAKQRLELHKIQLEQLKVEYLTLFGKL